MQLEYKKYKKVKFYRKAEVLHEIPIAHVTDEQSDEEGDQFSTIKRSPKDADKKSIASPTIEQQELVKNETNRQERSGKEEIVQQISEQQIVDEIIYGDFSTPGLQARALYDYQAGIFHYTIMYYMGGIFFKFQLMIQK